MTWRALAFVVAAVVFCLVTGRADATPGPRAASIQTWGKVPCRGDVKVVSRHLGGLQVGEARWLEDPVTHMRFQCRVYLDRRKATSRRQVCQTLVHEYGHLLGHEHSKRPRSVMFWKATPRNVPRACR